VPTETEVCPTCEKAGDLEPKQVVKEQHEGYTLKRFSCGHQAREHVVEIHESLDITATVGRPTEPFVVNLPNSQPNYERFGQVIKGNKAAEEYYQTTKPYRLAIARLALEKMAKEYNNSIAFGLYLTSFLAQAKAALDSLSQEINVKYALDERPDWAMDAEILAKDFIDCLRSKNSRMASHWEGIVKSDWYRDLKRLRDAEGIHRNRRPRAVQVGTKRHIIGIEDIEDIGPRCKGILKELDEAIEESYGLMLQAR